MSTDLGFTNLAFIGDSNTDSGELYRLSKQATGIGLPLSPPYAEQLTNGDVYADYLPGLLGVFGGAHMNYAVGGAKVLVDMTLEERFFGVDDSDPSDNPLIPDDMEEALETRVDLAGQVDRLLADYAGTDLSSLAVASYIGLNDMNERLVGDVPPTLNEIEAFVDEYMIAHFEQIDKLFDAGVGTVIVSQLAEGSFFRAIQDAGPEFEASSDLATTLINEALSAEIAARQDTQDIRIVDMSLITGEVSDDVTTFGFRSASDQLYHGVGAAPIRNVETLLVPKEQVLFMDDVHTTFENHEIWAAFYSESLLSEVGKGTAGDDSVDLGAADDMFFAKDGDDTLHGRGGDDVLFAGLGDDIMFGEMGEDILSGGSGDDIVRGGGGHDVIAGNDGHDTLYGGGGDDILVDGDGSDLIHGGKGDDVFVFVEPELFGGDSDDVNFLNGGSGEDTAVFVLRGSTKLIADVDMFFGGDGSAIFDDLGIHCSGIENFLFVSYDEGRLPDLELANATQAGMLAEAELWNIV